MRMRLLPLLPPLLFLLSCRSAPVAPFGAGTEELVNLERQLNEAITLRDGAKIASLTSPEHVLHFMDPNMTGTIRPAPAPRGNWISDLFADLSNGPLEWSLVDARVYGPIGVVASHYRWNGTYKGSGFQYEGYLTDVWIRRHMQWRLLSSTADVLPPCR